MKIFIAIVAVVVALVSGPAAAQSLAPNTAQQRPSVHLDAYAAKPSQTLAFTGTGFAPNETVDVSLSDQSLTTTTAYAEGRILHASIGIPL